MESEKDEGKQIVPLFPGLHILDGDKGGPRPPPRNKMALYEDYNMNPNPDLRPGQRPLPALTGSTFFSQPSSSNVSHKKMFFVQFIQSMCLPLCTFVI